MGELREARPARPPPTQRTRVRGRPAGGLGQTPFRPEVCALTVEVNHGRTASCLRRGGGVGRRGRVLTSKRA